MSEERRMDVCADSIILNGEQHQVRDGAGLRLQVELHLSNDSA